jgi:hypothetical protein
MRSAIIITILVSCIGCASLLKEKVDFHSTGAAETQNVEKPIKISLDTGYTRTIDANSTWQLVGNVSNHKFKDGKVYKPVGDVLSIEGTQRYEAYLVVLEGKIIGFYLPASSRFSPLKKQVAFP